MRRRQKGHALVIDELAIRFPQLYVRPAGDALEAYRAAALRGIPPKNRSLAHFTGSAEDALEHYDTPAGAVEVLYLARRDDFERALQCLARRCQPEAIHPTIGAMCLDGLADWSKIAAEHARATAAGEPWDEAFARFRSDPANYRTMLVVVSKGPYSAVDASLTPYGSTEWIEVSRTIRIYHELTHVICRRLMPEEKLPVFDEITADFCGLLSATGTFDPHLAAAFLGVSEKGYTGGRLETYLTDSARDINAIARECVATLFEIARICDGARPEDAFILALDLKRRRLLDY